MASLGELARQFDDLHQQKKKVSADEKSIAEAIKKLEPELMEAMGDAGLPCIRTDSGRTVYLYEETFVGPLPGETEEEKAENKRLLAEELARHEQTMDLVKTSFDARSLRSRLSEIEKNGESLPEELLRLMKITKVDRVGTRMTG